MSLVLVPPIVYLCARKQFPNQLLDWWVFCPTLVWFIKYIGGALIVLNQMPYALNIFINFLYGLGGLGLNLALLFWSAVKIRDLKA